MPIKIAKGETSEHFLEDKQEGDFSEGHQQHRKEEERDQGDDLILGKGDDGEQKKQRGDQLGPRVQTMHEGVLVGEPVQPADIDNIFHQRSLVSQEKRVPSIDEEYHTLR